MTDKAGDTKRLEEALSSVQGVVTSLLGKVNGLNDNTTILSESVERLTTRAKVNRRLIITIIIGFVLDITLTVIMAFVLNTQNTTTNRINALTQQLQQEQTVQRKEALCPLYQLFINADTPATRAA